MKISLSGVCMVIHDEKDAVVFGALVLDTIYDRDISASILVLWVSLRLLPCLALVSKVSNGAWRPL